MRGNAATKGKDTPGYVLIMSHLKQEDVPDKMEDTLALWKQVQKGRYDVYISETTIAEIMDAGEPKRSIMLNYLEQIDYMVLRLDDDVAIR